MWPAQAGRAARESGLLMETGLYYIKVIWQWMMSNLIFINLIFAIVIIFSQRKDPKSVWAWLLLLYSVPILGFLLYLIIGQDMHKSKMFRLKEMEDELNAVIKAQEEGLRQHEYSGRTPQFDDYQDLVLYNLESSGAVLSWDNKVSVLSDGREKFRKLTADLKNAEHFIHIQYYIIRDDELFDAIKETLIEKAGEGVEVRILYDSMGCKSMRKSRWKELEEKGIHTAEFFPAFLGRLQLRINYRNHRKIVVIDGKIGYVGGFNIGREYVGLDPKFGYWRDTHLRIEGSAVSELQTRFILDWNYAARENLFQDRSYYPRIEETFEGEGEVQIISSGPDSNYQNVRNNYLRLISKARKYIYIQTPYFIPDESILNALKIAAVSGIDVRVMIPCKPDHPFVYWATYSYAGELVAAGGRCYTYNEGFLHAKGMIVDGMVACYGTANMDIRSFKLNFEVNAVLYGEETVRELVDIFTEDLSNCTEITWDRYTQRKWYIKIKEQFCRLLSPLM